MARLGRIGWACSDGYKLLGGLLLKKSVLQIVLRRDRFFGPLKQFVEINSNVGKMLRGDFTVPLGGYLVTALF
jgi:hypothetical protein